MTINITTININFASIVDKTLLLYSSIFIHCVSINLDLKFLFHTFAKWLLYLSVELPLPLFFISSCNFTLLFGVLSFKRGRLPLAFILQHRCSMTNSFSFCLSGSVLIFSSVSKDSFDRYRIFYCFFFQILYPV